jgi:hypothetical protein
MLRPFIGVAFVALSSGASASAVSAGPLANHAALMRYGGLGSTVSAFYAENPHGTSFPPLGVAYYSVMRTSKGRVVAYQVEINAQPPDSSRERLALTGGTGLPADATQTQLNNNTCIVWKSKTLFKLIGMAYAAATTSPGSDSAQMRAERKPRC